MNPIEQVREFHTTYGAPIGKGPWFPDHEHRAMRMRLLAEEYNEYIDAEVVDDLVAVADGLADMVYIIYGTALAYGIPLDKIFDEVHRSNMSKLSADGKPIYREDGKILKGPNYFRPDIPRILFSDLEHSV